MPDKGTKAAALFSAIIGCYMAAALLGWIDTPRTPVATPTPQRLVAAPIMTGTKVTLRLSTVTPQPTPRPAATCAPGAMIPLLGVC